MYKRYVLKGKVLKKDSVVRLCLIPWKIFGGKLLKNFGGKYYENVFVSVSILYLSFYMSLSWSLSSLDDKLSENRWFVWSKRHTVEKVKSL